MSSNVNICILGDICPRYKRFWSFDHSVDRTDVFGDIAEVLRSSDFSVANLECPATERDTKIVKCGSNLKATLSDLEILKKAGVGVLALANNHILDYGNQAVFDTIESAHRLSIHTYGAGENIEVASKPLFVEKNGIKVGLLAYAEEEFNCATIDSPGANLFDPYTSLIDITNAKKQCDYLIVNYHGGIEYYRYPSPLLQKKCRAMADAGADIILCQHSHCIGTFEEYSKSMILYGQGNAIFGHIKGDNSWNTGLLVTVKLMPNVKPSIEFRVFEANTEGISFVSNEMNKARLQEMKEESSRLDDPDYVQKKWLEFCDGKASDYLPHLCCWGRIANKLNRLTDNLLGRMFLSQNQMRVTMNLIRCDAHREVVQTILENNVFRK